MAGPLSLDQIPKAVENGPRISDIHNQMAALTRMLENNQFTAGGSDRHSTTHATNARLVRQYGHPDGKYRRVPSDWKFPMLHLQPMYLYWHCGDESANIPPMKWFHATDVDFLGKRAHISLCEMRKVMLTVDKVATEQGFPPKDHMSLHEANTCYYRGERGIFDVVPENTPQGRPRIVARMKWGTVVKFMHKRRVRVW